MNSFSRLIFLALICVSAFEFAGPVQAKGQTEVSKDAVLAACRHTSGCSYDTDTNTGTTAGCSPHACFYCKGSTCHQTPSKEVAGVKPRQFDVTVLATPGSQISHGNGNLTQSQGASSLASKSAAVTSQGGLQQAIN